MKTNILRLVCAVVWAAAALPCGAQTYPSRLLTIDVPFPAGGAAEVAFRQLQPDLQAQLGQAVVIENVPGAGGSIGVQKVLASPADGHTLLGHTGSDLVLAPMAMSAVKYDPQQLRLVAPVGATDLVLVSAPRLAFKNADELVAYCRQPGARELAIGHWGRGSTPHIVGADFQNRAKVKWLEVPYKGVAPIIPDLVGGVVDLSFLPVAGPTLGLIRSGKVNAIGIASARRNPALPDVPVLSESAALQGFEHSLWSGLFVRRQVGDAEITKLTQALHRAMQTQGFASFMKEQAARAFEPMTPVQADQFFRRESERLSDIARLIKLQPE